MEQELVCNAKLFDCWPLKDYNFLPPDEGGREKKYIARSNGKDNEDI